MTPASATPTHRSGNILVVDDDAATRLYISRHLQRQNYRVTVATNGQEALERMQRQSFDVVLLDLVMPGLSGSQVLEQLKANPLLRSVPVIMISAMDDPDSAIHCIEKGAEDYLAKPLNPVLLKARINACVERKLLRDQEQAYLHQLEVEKSQAEAANRAKSAFFANMSHELRTPLNAILGYSEILQEDLEAEQFTRFIPDIEKIQTSGKQLLGIIDSILDLARIDSGKMDLYLENCDVRMFVDQIVDEVRSLAAANGNVLQAIYTEDLGTIQTDLSKLRQILWNLLTNAAKFTESGRIVLTVWQQDEKAEDEEIKAEKSKAEGEAEGENEALNPSSVASLSSFIFFQITDTGIGIPADHLDKIFEVFTQVDDSSTRKYGGTGLGLAVSHRFCQMLGGTIAVESRVNQGSTFTVRLPSHKIEETNPSHRSEETKNREEAKLVSGSQPLTKLVLVVDDNRAVRDRMVQILNQEGYRVVTTWYGGEGLRLARELHPDLIILDMLMPEMDSWAVLSTLKDDPALAKIPIIMQVLPASVAEVCQPEIQKYQGFVLGICDQLSQPEDFKRLATLLHQYQPSLKRADAPTQTQILLVQDEPTTQQILQRLLTKASWQVDRVSQSDAAIAYLQNHQPNLILLDLMLPNMDSFQFLARLRQSPAWRSLPTVAMLTQDLAPADYHHLNCCVAYLLQQGILDQDDLLRQVRDSALTHLRQQVG